MNGIGPKIPRELMRYAVLGVEFAVLVTGCVYGGVLLDRKLHTTPLFILLGMILGFAGGMYRFVRVAREYQKSLDEKRRGGPDRRDQTQS
jgi:F0F1-type ATP synthase assembly protein I